MTPADLRKFAANGDGASPAACEQAADALEASEARAAELSTDRDEWREQHERLLVMFRKAESDWTTELNRRRAVAAALEAHDYPDALDGEDEILSRIAEMARLLERERKGQEYIAKRALAEQARAAALAEGLWEAVRVVDAYDGTAADRLRALLAAGPTEAAEELAGLRAFFEASHIGARGELLFCECCGDPATRANHLGLGRRCDEHASVGATDLPLGQRGSEGGAMSVNGVCEHGVWLGSPCRQCAWRSPVTVVMYGVAPTEGTPWPLPFGDSVTITTTEWIPPTFDPVDLIATRHTAGRIALAWYALTDLSRILALVPRYVWAVRCTFTGAYFAADGQGVDSSLSKAARYTRAKAHALARKGCKPMGCKCVVVRIRLRGGG